MYFSVVPGRAPHHDAILDRLRFRNAALSPLGRIPEAGYVRHSAGVPPWRRYPRHALVFLFDGAGRYRDETGADQPVGAGDLLVIAPGRAHAYGPGPDECWSEFYLSFDGPVFSLWQARGAILDAQPPVRHLEPVDGWLRRFEGVLSQGADDALGEVCRLQTLLAEILAHGTKADPAPGDARWLARARVLLDADFAAERPIGAIAREMHLSVETFRRRFTRLAGQAPTRYRLARRVDRASELLRAGRPLKDVAATVGFYDEFHFSRLFKQITGESPSRFRERTRGTG